MSAAASRYDGWCGCHGDRNVPGCPGCPGKQRPSLIRRDLRYPGPMERLERWLNRGR